MAAYRDEPNWAAPLLMDLKKRLDQAKNPFLKHAQAEYFLVYREGRAVGRVSAHVDENFNSFQESDRGLFGWFECEDDPDAARALLAPRRRGCASTGATAWWGRWTSRPTTRSGF